MTNETPHTDGCKMWVCLLPVQFYLDSSGVFYVQARLVFLHGSL